jgi:hypothetical protein
MPCCPYTILVQSSGCAGLTLAVLDERIRRSLYASFEQRIHN